MSQLVRGKACNKNKILSFPRNARHVASHRFTARHVISLHVLAFLTKTHIRHLSLDPLHESGPLLRVQGLQVLEGGYPVAGLGAQRLHRQNHLLGVVRGERAERRHALHSRHLPSLIRAI